MSKSKPDGSTAEAATVRSQLRRIGLPEHAIQMTETEMSDELKSRLIACEHGNDIRQEMREWVAHRMLKSLPHPHL